MALVLGAGTWVSLRVRSPYPQIRSSAEGLRPNFDAATQLSIQHAQRVVFLVPFSHWDTDWHDIFDSYSRLADQNILRAIQVAKEQPRFRFALEQVLFVQHFWDTHPEDRAALLDLVHKRQIVFAWAGITQPETSLVAPSIQVHNLELGQAWIAQTFGREYVPRTAWQSDAFGNSAAFATFLAEFNIPYLFIGRHQGRCDPDYQNCQTLPPAFYWTSPASPQNSAGRVLVAYVSYPVAWGDIYQQTDPKAQLAALESTIDAEFKQTGSKYLFLPVGFDFFDPQANVLPLTDRWNAEHHDTLLVVSDPDSAFQYLATQSLPNITTDLNPIWQAFYNTRPAAKIADKESEYYLTAADKFGMLANAGPPAVWMDAAINAHYDNVSGVSFDSVWNNSQAPRFAKTVSEAKDELAGTLSSLAGRISAPLIVFNPSSWPRSEVIELTGTNLPDPNLLPGPVQRIGTTTLAFRAQAIPSVGYSGLNNGTGGVAHPASATVDGDRVRLMNGLISVTLDGAHGAAFSSLALLNQNGTLHELLSGFGDDITYWDDQGDVYGAFFGQRRAQESKVTAQLTVLASGPLIARVQAVFQLGGQQVVKTVTVRADDPLIEVELAINTLPNTTAISETSTVLDATMRTDDLGFGDFEHAIDVRPIAPGDVTYRRSIFYPITYWSDVSTGGAGLALITHGLQGVSGGSQRGLMLVREVTSRDEGLTDPGVHHLAYGYLPHAGTAASAQVWLRAYEFNQPLIPAWRNGQQVAVQLPFDAMGSPRQFLTSSSAAELPEQFSLLSAQNAMIADLYPQGSLIQAVALSYDPRSPGTMQVGGRRIQIPQGVFRLLPIPASDLGLPKP